MKKYLMILCLPMLALPVSAQESTRVLELENSAFDQKDEHGHPAGWGVSHPVHLERNHSRVRVIEEENLSFMRMQKLEPVENVNFGGQEVDIPEGAVALRVTVRMRGAAVKQGPDNWHFPGVGVTYFLGTDETRPGQMDRWIRLPEGDSGWRVYESDIPVRGNARRASIGIVSQGWTGAADLADIQVQAVFEGH